jgi:hypothetical protein
LEHAPYTTLAPCTITGATDMKTHEEMHEMSLTELKDYIQDVWSHLYDSQAIREYRSKIGEPNLLAAPTEVEFEEEE